MNSPVVFGYSMLILLCIAGFAVYDAARARVPNKALLLFLPFVMPAPAINSAYEINLHMNPYLSAILGAADGFLVLLAAALCSKNGAGVGGGDIKLAAILGYIFGPAEILGVMLIASLTALPVVWFRSRASGGRVLRMPFVPFLFLGCLTVMAARLLL